MKHCMMDLETWGTTPGSALRSIGAVMFELDGSIGHKFYRNIDIAEQRVHGLTQDVRTIQWWENQSEEAKQLLDHQQCSLTEAITKFNEGFKQDGGVFIWSHGGAFDTVLWEAACRAAGRAVPWHFRNVRCTRTWYQAFEFDPKSIEFEGVKHFALDDALHQIRCVVAALTRKPLAIAAIGSLESPLIATGGSTITMTGHGRD